MCKSWGIGCSLAAWNARGCREPFATGEISWQNSVSSGKRLPTPLATPLCSRRIDRRRLEHASLCSAPSRMPAVVRQAESLGLDAGARRRAADVELADVAGRWSGEQGGRRADASRRRVGRSSDSLISTTKVRSAAIAGRRDAHDRGEYVAARPSRRRWRRIGCGAKCCQDVG